MPMILEREPSALRRVRPARLGGISALSSRKSTGSTFIEPESAFRLHLSVELLVIVVVGGLGSLHGAVLGAAFIVMLPQFIILLRDAIGISTAYQAGLDAGAYGLLMVFFMLFEPRGIHGRWVKIRTYLELFPFYRKASSKHQRQYHKSEQLR